jgi:hypothetical protein
MSDIGSIHIMAAARAGFSGMTASYWKDWLECFGATKITPEEFVEFIRDREDEIGSSLGDNIRTIWRDEEEEDDE